MASKKPRKAPDDPRRLSPREEMAIELLRCLTSHQQREEILRLHAMCEANEVSRKLMKGRLNAVSNEAVAALYKKTPAPTKGADEESEEEARTRPG